MQLLICIAIGHSTDCKVPVCLQLLHVTAKKLDFPLGSPLHAEAAHQEDVGMDIVFSIHHITPDEEKADKTRSASKDVGCWVLDTVMLLPLHLLVVMCIGCTQCLEGRYRQGRRQDCWASALFLIRLVTANPRYESCMFRVLSTHTRAIANVVCRDEQPSLQDLQDQWRNEVGGVVPERYSACYYESATRC